MKLLLLNIHLEWNHNRLRKLVEKDTREGMDEVFLVMYDYEGYKKKKSLESLLQENPKALVEPLPLPSPDSIKFELSEEEEDVDDPPDAEPTQGQQLAHGSSSLTQAESVKAEKSKKYGIEKSCYEVMVGVSHAGKAVPQKDSWARTFDTI